jgi:hypothetical protein
MQQDICNQCLTLLDCTSSALLHVPIVPRTGQHLNNACMTWPVKRSGAIVGFHPNAQSDTIMTTASDSDMQSEVCRLAVLRWDQPARVLDLCLLCIGVDRY